VGLLHTTVTVAVAYQLYFSGAGPAAPFTTIGLLAACVALSLLMVSVRESVLLSQSWFISTIALADTALATTALYLVHGQAPALYLVYFLIMLIATSSPSLPLTCGVSVLLTLAYGSQLYLWHLYDETHLLQLPILFTMAAFYAYNSEATRQELKRLGQMATKGQRDPLTHLPNREQFLTDLQTALPHVSPYGPPSLAVLFVDLDKFKPVNDTFGHQIGDQLLIAVAQRMMACVRAGDVVSRYGGDEFTLLLRVLHGTEDAERTVARLLDSLRQPFQLGGHDIQIGASIGMAVKTNVWDHAEDLITRADAAMYRVKQGHPWKAAA
jgi:diguanylate cyclase (GGDEF)-like protein